MSTELTRTESIVLTAAEAAELELGIERLEEALDDARLQLAADDVGWAKLLSAPGAGGELDREKLKAAARQARVMSVHDPLIRRAVSLRVAYVWGLGVTISAASPEDQQGGQDVNAVVQAFLLDNKATFGGLAACEERARALMTDGNVFLALPTDRATGRVQVRTIPDAEIADILTDPEDADTPWFYKRTYSVTRLAAATERGSGLTTTITRTEMRTVYYPALDYRPRFRVNRIDGHPVEWDTPVYHARVNRPSGSRWGTPDLLAAIPWALGYKTFLEDWARYMKAVALIAFKATARDRRGAKATREALATAAASGEVGGTIVVPEGQRFEPVGRASAILDSGSGKPLAAMVASATDVPVTMLTGDPGITGARATAETLDRPLELVTRMRRDLEAAIISRVLLYVVEQAVKAPAGTLRGTVRIDPVTGREVIVLAGDQDPAINVEWPPLEDVSIEVLVNAIAKADETGKLHPEVIARLLLIALGVPDVDDELDAHRDDEGNYEPPAAPSPDNAAAAAALSAFNGGEGAPSPIG